MFHNVRPHIISRFATVKHFITCLRFVFIKTVLLIAKPPFIPERRFSYFSIISQSTRQILSHEETDILSLGV